MPSGKSAPGTTWRPTEVATTPWAPNLKPSATKLSKNNITQHRTLQAISMPTFNLLPPMSVSIGVRVPKHYPAPSQQPGFPKPASP
jgi:hypothetical protein